MMIISKEDMYHTVKGGPTKIQREKQKLKIIKLILHGTVPRNKTKQKIIRPNPKRLLELKNSNIAKNWFKTL